MSRFYSGKDGALYYGPEDVYPNITPTKRVARVTQWSFQTQMDLLDTTSLGHTETTSTPGLRTHTGSARVLYYQDDALGENSASVLLQALLEPRKDPLIPEIAGDPVIWRIGLRVVESPTSFKRIQGPVWITNASMNMAVGDIFGMDIDFTFLGAPVTVTV